jgi:hypothetical protein
MGEVERHDNGEQPGCQAFFAGINPSPIITNGCLMGGNDIGTKFPLPCGHGSPPSHINHHINKNPVSLTYTLSTGANLDRFSTRFLRPLPDRPEIMTLPGDARSAGAGGAGTGHRDRGDVGPCPLGPPRPRLPSLRALYGY